jgi:hypothetical protein
MVLWWQWCAVVQSCSRSSHCGHGCSKYSSLKNGVQDGIGITHNTAESRWIGQRHRI